MDIGVMGWWHHDNQGDSKILESMDRALAPHRIVPIDLPFPLNEDSLHRLNLLDFLILGGGGLFQDAPPPRPFDTFDAWGRQLETPIGAIGIGIDVIHPQYRSSVLALVDQARFFHVRDQTSQHLVGHPKVQVAPDLSFLCPLEGSAGTRALPGNPAVCGVNLRKSGGLETGRWVETLRGLPLRLRGIPLSTFDAWQEVQVLRQLDEASATAFDPALYEELDLMVGTAFHSVVFAIQAAVPVIGLAYAPKVRRLMADLGLEDYVLEPDEWHKLPALVVRVLDEHGRLVARLQETTTALTQSARQAVADVREEIERTAHSRARSGPRVSVVVVGTALDRASQTTLESCLSQTYRNVEVILSTDDAREPHVSTPAVKVVPGDPVESLGERLNRAFAHATGEYLSWVMVGDCFARDAIDCMVSRLQQDPACDMVFTDYYTVHERGRIASAHSVHPAYKLFRRNVVGPCFLYHRRLLESAGPLGGDTPLVAYDYWLRAHRGCRLQPMHVRLYYHLASNETANDPRAERQARRLWRANDPWLFQVLWRIVDTDLVERYLIRPLMVILRKAKSVARRLAASRRIG